jgi:hypothetical protein
MNASPVITQAFIDTRQQDRLARARQARQACAAREAAARARRTSPETFLWPVRWFRFTVRRTASRDAV